MPRQGKTTQSIYTDERHYNTVRAGVIAANDPNDNRTQDVIAKSVGISQSSLSSFAIQQSNGTFPTSYEQARAQGRGMGGGGDPELRSFSEDNIDTDDIGMGMKSQLSRNFSAQFPLKNVAAKNKGMFSVRRMIKRLRRQREERAALAAEALVDDDSSSSSDDDEEFR